MARVWFAHRFPGLDDRAEWIARILFPLEMLYSLLLLAFVKYRISRVVLSEDEDVEDSESSIVSDEVLLFFFHTKQRCHPECETTHHSHALPYSSSTTIGSRRRRCRRFEEEEENEEGEGETHL